jgi:hypothetical protein
MKHSPSCLFFSSLILSVHRRAIRKAASTRPPLRKSQVSFSSNAALLRCVDALMKASVLVNADLSTESILRRIVDGELSNMGICTSSSVNSSSFFY